MTADAGTTRAAVLITGASGGIGAELARLFAAGGHHLFLVARRERELQSLADELRKAHGVEVDVMSLDLARMDAPDRLAAEVERRGVHVETLVNNAGFGLVGQTATLDRKEQLEIIDLNVRALADLTMRFLPGMLARRAGGILNVGSIAGMVPGPYMSVYHASKAFVASFTAAIAEECRGSGLRFTNLAPGPVETGFRTRAGVPHSRLVAGLPGPDVAAVARAGYGAYMKGRPLAIPRGMHRLMAFLSRIVPAGIRSRAMSRVLKPR